MALKDKLNYVKDELSGDEKLLENAFRIESFIRKNRKKLISIVIILVIGISSYNIYGALKESSTKKSSDIFTKLISDTENRELQENVIKSNREL